MIALVVVDQSTRYSVFDATSADIALSKIAIHVDAAAAGVHPEGPAAWARSRGWTAAILDADEVAARDRAADLRGAVELKRGVYRTAKADVATGRAKPTRLVEARRNYREALAALRPVAHLAAPLDQRVHVPWGAP
jgi:hypothetical protein